MHYCTFGESRDFAMLHQSDVEFFGVLHGAAHDDRVLHPIAIVGVQSHSILSQGMKWAELQPSTIHSDTRRRHDID